MARTLRQYRANPTQAMNRALRDMMKEEREAKARREKRIRRAGELVEQAGLLEEPDDELMGFLLTGPAELEKAAVRERLRASGHAALNPPETVHYPIVAVFSAGLSLSKQARTALAAEGLRETRTPAIKAALGAADQQVWQGEVEDYDRTVRVVEANGGSVRRIGEMKEAAE